MPYILNKTNGTKLATLQDASLDLTTNLTFVGRNYSGYGEIFNENFIKLLENFSNTTAPTRPVQGQIWFDSDNRRLNVCYDGKNFKSVASIRVEDAQPTGSNSQGDLWWDSSRDQLKGFDGSAWQLIGPLTSAVSKSSWSFEEELSQGDATNTAIPLIKGKVGSSVIATICASAAPNLTNGFTPKNTSDLYTSFGNQGTITEGVRKGITLTGADQYGSTQSAGYYFWGTAADALTANTSTNVTVSTISTNADFYIPFVSALSGRLPLKSDAGLTYNPSTNALGSVASQAVYADLAERYEADAVYDEGTVLMIGGDKEVTISIGHATTAVAGIVSKNPGYLMNSKAGTDETHPGIALKGRVPCKIEGAVKKGDLLVTSGTIPGHATKKHGLDSSDAVIGKALEDFEGPVGVIEVKV